MLEIKIRYKENCCTDVTWEEGLDAQGLGPESGFQRNHMARKEGTWNLLQ